MRVLTVVFSLVVTVSLAGAALFYLGERIGQHRIQVQDEWLSSSDQPAYRGYGVPEMPDTARVIVADSAR